MGICDLLKSITGCIFGIYRNFKIMKARYQITSDEIGTIKLKRRKVAKALRWWLRQNGFTYSQSFFCI